MIVVDASLATKLVVDEADSGLADRWFRGRQDAIVAPDLIAIEVTQAAVRRVNDRHTSLETGQTALGRWHDLLIGEGIQLVRTEPPDVMAAAEIAMQLGHPVKDCVYLAMAIARNVGLITCDGKFAAKARAVHAKVALLADHVS